MFVRRKGSLDHRSARVVELGRDNYARIIMRSRAVQIHHRPSTESRPWPVHRNGRTSRPGPPREPDGSRFPRSSSRKGCKRNTTASKPSYLSAAKQFAAAAPAEPPVHSVSQSIVARVRLTGGDPLAIVQARRLENLTLTAARAHYRQPAAIWPSAVKGKWRRASLLRAIETCRIRQVGALGRLAQPVWSDINNHAFGCRAIVNRQPGSKASDLKRALNQQSGGGFIRPAFDVNALPCRLGILGSLCFETARLKSSRETTRRPISGFAGSDLEFHWRSSAGAIFEKS